MIEDSKKLFQDLNIDIDPKEKMHNLTVGKQQMCEIAKAISHKAEVIIFDEPSAALTEKEIADLFVIIRDLREKVWVLSIFLTVWMRSRLLQTVLLLCVTAVMLELLSQRQYKRRYHQHDGGTCYL